MSLVSTLYRRGPPEPMTEAEKDELARQAWHEGSDLVTLRMSAIKNDIDKQAVVNVATRQHGARPKRKK